MAHQFTYRSLCTLFFVVSSTVASAADPIATIPGVPHVDAHNYVLQDPDSNEILVKRASDQQEPPASLTKLMTAYLTFQALSDGRLKLDQTGAVSVKAWKAGGSTMFLQPGLPVTVEQMVRGLVVVSGNDAAVALAETIAGNTDSFVQMMNATAKQLGMSQSHFDNVNGLPTPTHLQSARDIALLSADIIRQFPQYLKYFGEQTFTYNNITQRNWNPLLFSDPTVTGMKTGHTDEAGYCLDATAVRNGHRLIAVVLGSRTRSDSAKAAEALLNYGYRNFEFHQAYRAGQTISHVLDTWAHPANVALGVSRDVWVTLPAGHYGQLKSSLSLPDELPLPLKRGQIVGSLILSDGEREVSRIPLSVLRPVQKAGWLVHCWNVVKAKI